MARQYSRPIKPGAGVTSPRQSVENHAASYDPSPPHTPPAQVARVPRGRGAAAKAPRVRPLTRDAFDEHARDEAAATRTTPAEHARQRSSHDLSWSPRRARDSVVDNMLLSLDQLGDAPAVPSRPVVPGRALFQEEDEEDGYSDHVEAAEGHPYADARRNAPGPGRARAHTHAASHSSGYSVPADLINPPKRQGHRSNSSSGFQTSLGRIDSTHTAGNTSRSAMGAARRDHLPADTVPEPDRTPPRPTTHQRGSSSPDIAQALDNAPWQRNLNRRSASFDHSYAQSARPGNLPPLITSTDRSFFFDEIEAAPTPTVPAGPRHGPFSVQTSTFRPTSSIASPKQNMHRRGSLRAPLSLFGRSDKDRSVSHQPVKSSMRGFHLPDNSGDAPRLAPSRVDSGHPPDVRVPSSTSHNTPSSTGKDKERPGFFRRVFGSRNTTPVRHDVADSATKGLPAGSGRLPVPTPHASIENRASDVGHAPSPYRAPSRERQPLKEQPSQVLNKKSSFFRRRRKSVTEATPVPAFPPQLEPHSYAPTAPQSRGSTAPVGPPPPLSPTSSLRKVMNPYIDDVPPARRDAKSRHLHTESRGAASPPPIAPLGDEERVAPPYPAGHEARPRWPEYEQDTIRAAHQPAAHPPLDRVSTDTGRPRASTGHSRAPSDVHKELPALPPEPSALDEPDGLYMRSSPAKTAKPPENALERPLPKVRQPRWPPRAEETARPVLSRISTAPDMRNDSARASGSTLGDYQSATSKIHSPMPDADLSAAALDAAKALSSMEHEKVEDAAASAADDGAPGTEPPAPALNDTAPSAEDRALAEKLLHGEAEAVPREETVAYLGTASEGRAQVRQAFVDLFDWRDASILTALRDFCARVPLRGETQQVDRVLDVLAHRWCACNPHHGFQAADVVHTICYSLLLLNTDLHLADIDSKMTRQQFVRNTMPTIRRVVVDAAPDAFEQGRSSMLPPPRSPIVSLADAQGAPKSGGDVPDGAEAASQPGDARPDDCGPLVKEPFRGKLGSWETLVEAVLRNFYQSIRQERLPLHGSAEAEPPVPSQPSSTSLSAMSSMLRRTNSMLSKAGSETFPTRGRLDQRSGLGGSSRWSSKARSRPRLYPPSIGRSRTSLDDGDATSALSPSGSSLWSSSRLSLGKTQTSMSINSYASDRSGRGAGDYQQSIGFANALSQAIIREEAAGAGGADDDGDGADETVRAAPLLEDESLELAGAPWAKEGLVKHKRHLEAADRRARDRTWTDCFAVVEKGWMRLFQFPVGSRSLRHKARAASGRHHPPASSSGLAGSAGAVGGGGPVVGGGNWLDNAQPLDQFALRHTLASALPPPGYSKARPHVWALSLPTGAVHLFHAGTAEIVREFVAAANYWSARLSKEPLFGAVSNVEYGWSERIINLALLAGADGRPPSAAPPPLPSNASIASGSGVPRPSLQSSIRSSFDQSVGAARPRLPGDKVPLGDWSPPSQSMLASQLLEVDQLRALTTYVRNVEEELKRHNELRGAILLAVSRVPPRSGHLVPLLTCGQFTPRHPNHAKALANWERKSSYLLREIVKFSTYTDCLHSAKTAKEKVYAERDKPAREDAADVPEKSGDAPDLVAVDATA